METVQRLMTRTLVALVLLGLLLPSAAEGVLRIEITQGVTGAIPVAVVPFSKQADDAGLPDAAGVIAANLARSGRFDLFPEEDMLERPSDADQVNFQNWRALGVDNLVIGSVRRMDNGYALQFQLFNALRGRQMIGYSIPVRNRASLRRAAHMASDMIYEQLTGERGAFATRIAFIVAERSPGMRSYTLMAADADGENQQVVVRSNEPLMSPVWSPDGRRIAYVSFENRRPEVFVQELASGTRERVSARGQGVNGAPAWSPDGKRLALALNEGEVINIHLLDLETQEIRRLTSSSAIDTEPAFTPDGRFLYFTSDRGGRPQVYRIAVDGGQATRVTYEGDYNARPALSQDGRYLAVVYGDQRRYRIGVYDLQSGAFRILSDGRFDESPTFAPNSRMVMYATESQGDGVLATVSVDGRVRQQLGLAAGDVREPAWAPYPDNER